MKAVEVVDSDMLSDIQAFLAYFTHVIKGASGLLDGGGASAQFLRWLASIATSLIGMGLLVSTVIMITRRTGKMHNSNGYEWDASAVKIEKVYKKSESTTRKEESAPLENKKDVVAEKEDVAVEVEETAKEVRGVFHQKALEDMIYSMSDEERSQLKGVEFLDPWPEEYGASYGVHFKGAGNIILNPKLYDYDISFLEEVFYHEFGHRRDDEGGYSDSLDFVMAWVSDRDWSDDYMKDRFGEARTFGGVPYPDALDEVFAQTYYLARIQDKGMQRGAPSLYRYHQSI